jgi:hypothetical protein
MLSEIMRPDSESKLVLSVAWLASLGILAWLVAHAGRRSGVAVALGIVVSIAVLAIGTLALACPRCNRSLYGANRARCRVCGFDLRGGNDGH